MPSRLPLPAVLFHSFLAVSIGVLLCILLYLYGLWRDLPDISDPQALLAVQSMVIRDSTGGELFRFYDEQDRTTVSLAQVSPHFLDAIIAIEDKRFFERSCVDVRSLLRAAIANMRDFKSQGASTITQQLVRTAVLHRGKTVERKLKEMMLACQMEQRYTKEDILEMYVNWIAFGHGIAGIEQASKLYFGVDASQLTLPQSAALASLPQRPTYFSPYGPHRRSVPTSELVKALRQGTITDAQHITSNHIQMGLLSGRIRIGDVLAALPGRADIVLQAMHDQDFITAPQLQQAQAQLAVLNFTPNAIALHAPHFVLTLHDELTQAFPGKGSLSVHTTIDPALQQLGEQVIEAALPALRNEYGAHNAALLAIDLRTNAVLAYVGNADFFDSQHAGQVDMVRIPRQTGSAFKPFLYASLLEQPEYSKESTIYDTPLNPRIYRPFRSGYYGRMTVNTALARSRNTPAIRAFYLAGGEDAVLNTAARLGVRTPQEYKDAVTRRHPRFQYGWPLALGAAESSLFEVLQGFSVLAHGGWHTPLTAVRSIVSDDDVVYTPQISSTAVIESRVADQIVAALRDEEARETLWRSTLNIPFADASVKTGTSNVCMQRDAYGSCSSILPGNSWTVGFAGNLLVGVWIGNADSTPLLEEGVSINTAAPLWKKFIVDAHALSSLSSLTYTPQ